MNGFRELLSTLFFITAVVLVIQLVFSGFSWGMLALTLACYGVAYVLWPSKNKGQRRDDNGVLDFIEFIIECPITLIIWLARILSRLFRADSDLWP